MNSKYEERNRAIFYDKVRRNMSLSRVYQILKRERQKDRDGMEKTYRSFDPGRPLSVDEN